MNEKNYLFFIIERLDNIISNMDNKSSFLLAFSTAVILYTGFEYENYTDFFIPVIMILITFSFSAIMSVLVLWPRAAYKKLDKSSVFFYKDIKNNKNFKQYISELTDSEIEDDEKNQIYALAAIINKKVILNKISIFSLCIGVLFIILLLSLKLKLL